MGGGAYGTDKRRPGVTKGVNAAKKESVFFQKNLYFGMSFEPVRGAPVFFCATMRTREKDGRNQE